MFGIWAGNTVDYTGMFLISLSSACTWLVIFLPLTSPQQQGGWVCTCCWDGAQPGKLTPTDQSSIPWHMMLWPAKQLKGKTRKARWREDTFGVTVFYLPKWLSCMMEPCFLRRLSTCLPVRGGKLILCFALLVCSGLFLVLFCFVSYY